MPQLTTVDDVRSLLAREGGLDGDGVRLRAPREDDVPAIVQLCQDPDMVRWTGVPSPYGPREAREFLERTAAQHEAGERRTWVVEAGARGFAGFCALRVAGAGLVELSYAAHPGARGRGLTTAAVRAVCDFAFEHGVEAVLWHALVGNFASRRVAWRCGFDVGASAWRGGPGVRGHRLEEVWPGVLRRDEPMQPRRRWLETPTLTGAGVLLRPFSERDGAQLPESHDELVERFSPTVPTSVDYLPWLVQQRSRAADGVALTWAVVDVDDRLLGGVDLFRLEVPSLSGTGMLGYWLLPQGRGRGVLRGALDTLLAWALTPSAHGGLGLHAVSAGCAQTNRASARALRRAGFSDVGVQRRLLQDEGAACDGLLFDLLDSDDRAATGREPGRVPTMQTARFQLRQWRDTDVPGPGPDEGPDRDSLAFMPSGVHPDAATFAGWLRTRRVHLDSGEHLNWCLADRESDHALGNVVVFGLGPPQGRFQGELGYWLHPVARGRGALQEVLPLVVDHSFRAVAEGGLGLTRLHAGTDLDNAASQALLQRVGFRRWGQDRQAFRNGAGGLTDGAFFELLATDERSDQRPQRGARLSGLTLEGRHLRLRPWRQDDVPRIVEACRDARSRRWLPRLPDPYSAEDAAQYIALSERRARLGSMLTLAVADPATDQCLGSIALLDLDEGDPTCAEVGYWTHPTARGRGVMSAAVELLVAHALRPREAGGLGLRRLTLSAAIDNRASQHVAEAAGFVRGGVRRAADPLGDGTFDDIVDFDLLNPDWTP